ncbi:MAG: adenosylmethionine--8-amino-7-oxononanoate transaminase [Planctomycetes bacterium]|nr:adenosylmethionine--8-amino-7-oxononanoate transaminase [Planctomycetota bacterium]
MPDIAEIDKRYVWHPFTQMRDWVRGDAIVIESGHGVMLRDTEGREYLDGVSSLWCNVHGHRRREIDQAIIDQLGRIAHSTLLGLASAPSALLAERLVRLAPRGLTRVFYSDSGATAVEVALKMAFQYWRQRRRGPRPGKTRFVALRHSYHGDTLGAVGVGGIELFHHLFQPLLFDAHFIPSPGERPARGVTREQHLGRCLEELEKLLRSRGGEVAALIVEPLVQGAAGMLVSPPGALSALRRLCDRYQVLLIADEVAVGFGRTGRMFACEHEDVTPDLLCLGKGLSGGYLPLAATLATDRVYEAFLGEYGEFRTFFHGHTFTGNALACAAALASLDVFEEDRVLEKLRDRIEQMHHQLRTRFAPLPHVGETRQCGFMAGIELVQKREPWTDYPLEKQMGYRVCREARRHGILIRPLGNVIVILPPLCISEEDMDRLLEGIFQSVRTVTHGSQTEQRKGRRKGKREPS